VRDLRPRTTAGFLPTMEYLRKHDMRMEGEPVEPFQTFESVGLPPDIMDEASTHIHTHTRMHTHTHTHTQIHTHTHTNTHTHTHRMHLQVLMCIRACNAQVLLQWVAN